MINTPLLAIILGILVFFGKLSLLIYWARNLHKVHGDRYDFMTLFGMMFAPQTESSMDPFLWNDFKPIQKRNFVSNVWIVITGFVLLAAALIFNRYHR
jgi:hypothetical protein